MAGLRMKLIRGIRSKLLYFHYSVAGTVAVVALVAALSADPIADVSGVASSGFYGALIVLCVTSIAALESLKTSESRRQKVLAGGVGVGLLAGAYLWLADEADVHPASLELLSGLGIVWLLVSIIVFIFFLLALIAR